MSANVLLQKCYYDIFRHMNYQKKYWHKVHFQIIFHQPLSLTM